VRRMDWAYTALESAPGTAAARFTLSDNSLTRAAWPFAFTLNLTVTLAADWLDMRLQVVNPGTQTFQFTAALHTYLSVADIRAARLEGLGGASYLDTVGTRTERTQYESDLVFNGEVDRIYWNVKQPLVLHDEQRRLQIQNSGFPHAVVWNPWIEKSAALGDMPQGEYLRMLCVEAVATGQPLTLPAGEAWQGAQRLTV